MEQVTHTATPGPLARDLVDEVAAYVNAHPRATLYHTPRWVTFTASVFGLHSVWNIARDASGQIRGVLPLVRQNSLAFGSRWVSLPFVNYGGPIGDDSDIELGLIHRAADFGRTTGIRTVEIRDSVDRPGLSVRTDKVSPVLGLPTSTEILGKTLGAKLRSQIRRVDRESPSVHVGGAELVGDFFSVFATTMRDLGTPVYPRRFFDQMFQDVGTDCTLVVVRLAGRPAAAAVLTSWRDIIEIPWAVSLHELRATSVNMRLYWECLSLAISRGAQWFDFGRSTLDAGTYRFKLQWGAQPQPLYWYYPLEPAGQRPPNSESTVVNTARRLWTRLPLPVANSLGRLLSPGLPW